MNNLFESRNRNRNRTQTGHFVPRTRDEYEIHEIAKALHDPYIDYLKSILDRYGIELIRDAWTEFQRIYERGTAIRNPGGFFNSLINKRIPDKEARKVS